MAKRKTISRDSILSILLLYTNTYYVFSFLFCCLCGAAIHGPFDDIVGNENENDDDNAQELMEAPTKKNKTVHRNT